VSLALNTRGNLSTDWGNLNPGQPGVRKLGGAIGTEGARLSHFDLEKGERVIGRGSGVQIADSLKMKKKGIHGAPYQARGRIKGGGIPPMAARGG